MAVRETDRRVPLMEFAGSFLLLLGIGLLSLLQSKHLSYGAAVCLSYLVLYLALYPLHSVRLNPVLTLTDVFLGRVTIMGGMVVMLLQMLGAIAGAFLVALICSTPVFLPAGVEGNSAHVMLAQTVFCTALAFIHIDLAAEPSSRMPGIAVALATYAAYTATAGLSGYLNPAVAGALTLSNAYRGVTVVPDVVASFVTVPFLGAAVGWGLFKLTQDNLLMAELVGSMIFTYNVCCALAGGLNTTNSAISIGCMAAAIVYTTGWRSGGAINPAISFGTLPGGYNKVRDVALYSAFQCAGGALGAVLARHTMGQLGLLNILRGGHTLTDIGMLFGFGALLMAAYSFSFGDRLGRPAGLVVGLVYFAFHMLFTKGVSINVQSIFGIIVSQLLNGYVEDPRNSLVCLLAPFAGSLTAAALLTLLPTRYQRLP